MEKMPYRSDMDLHMPIPTMEPVTTTDWQERLPVMAGRHVTLRQLRTSDAASLFAMLTTEEVSRFISPPPTSVEGFERFITWAQMQQGNGAYACFAVTVGNNDTAIGIFQLRQLEPGFGTAEWGFAIGSAFWGTGVFKEGAELMINFAFDVVGVHRLEARAAAKNGRGNGALRKMGAVQEGVLRKSFVKDGEYLDQVLWTILEEDWRHAKVVWTGVTLH